VKTIIYYSHQPDARPAAYEAAIMRGIEEVRPPEALMVAVLRHRPEHVPESWLVLTQPRDHRGPYADCYTRILAGLEVASPGPVYLVEHDCLYGPNYFDFAPFDANRQAFWYNTNLWTLTRRGWGRDPGRTVTSQLVADRDLLHHHFDAAMAWICQGKRIVWDEPGKGWANEEGTFRPVAPLRVWNAPAPSVDIRDGRNLTGDREYSPYEERVEPWGDWREVWRRVQAEEAGR
jgi:hypothetical protein